MPIDFSTILVAAACIVEQDGKYLMIQEGHQFAAGMWSHPAGLVEKGERLADAARREVQEETGYEVEIIGVLAVTNLQKVAFRDYHSPHQHVLKVTFAGRLVGTPAGEREAEIKDVQWLTKEEILARAEQLRDKDIPMLIERMERKQTLPPDALVEFEQ
mgnify:FL=1